MKLGQAELLAVVVEHPGHPDQKVHGRRLGVARGTAAARDLIGKLKKSPEYVPKPGEKKVGVRQLRPGTAAARNWIAKMKRSPEYVPKPGEKKVGKR